jgi:hypothetical protein
MSNYINFHGIICSDEAKNVGKLNYFKKQFLVHITYVLRKYSALKYSF